MALSQESLDSRSIPETTPRVASVGVTLAGAGAPPEVPTKAVQIHQAVVSPPSPLAYRGIQVGPEMSLGYENNQAVQVKSSDGWLRSLSPFMLQIEPPLVFAEDNGFLNYNKRGKVNIGAYSAAQTSGDTYAAARAVIQSSGLSGIGDARSHVETVVSNSSGPATSLNASQTAVDMNGHGKLGKPAKTDIYAALDIAQQLSAIMNAPPLILLINPTTMSINRTKIQQFSDRSRNGYIFHTWGEDQARISITARCGAFISGGRGVHVASKRDSAAWQNLMNLFHFYKSNGYIYDLVGHSNAHHFVGCLSIRYDQWVYYGHMGSFNYTYDESNMLGGMEFTMEFVASKIVDTAQATTLVQPMTSPNPSGLRTVSKSGGPQAVSAEVVANTPVGTVTAFSQPEVAPAKAVSQAGVKEVQAFLNPM